MSTEKTHLKNDVLAGASNTKSDGMIISTGNAKQNGFFLVAGSLLASFACIIAYVSMSGGQYLESSVNEMYESTGALSLGIYEATSGSLEHAETDVPTCFRCSWLQFTDCCNARASEGHMCRPRDGGHCMDVNPACRCSSF